MLIAWDVLLDKSLSELLGKWVSFQATQTL